MFQQILHDASNAYKGATSSAAAIMLLQFHRQFIPDACVLYCRLQPFHPVILPI